MARASKRLRGNAEVSQASTPHQMDANDTASVTGTGDVLDLSASSPPPAKRRSKRKGHGKGSNRPAAKSKEPEPVDRLSPLSAELIALILQQLSAGNDLDLASLNAVCLTSKVSDAESVAFAISLADCRTHRLSFLTLAKKCIACSQSGLESRRTRFIALCMVAES